MFKTGEELELTVEKFAGRGKCLSRHEGFVIFIEGTIPGERVKVRIHKTRKDYAEAKLLEVLEKSPIRVTPPCSYFGYCGGCKWQHVSYDRQLEAKQQSIKDALITISGFETVQIHPTIGSTRIYGYRNKMEYSFSNRRWLTEKEIASGETFDTSFALGLHAPGQYSSVIDIRECHLQRSPSSGILNTVRDISMQNGWAAWDSRKQKGFLEHLIIRIGERTGEIIVNLVTRGYKPGRIKLLAEVLQSSFPEITTFVNTIHEISNRTAPEEELETICGPGIIHDSIGNYTFEIAPHSFFQPNTSQAEVLYKVARDFAELKPTDVLYDLYCGAGTISIFVSSFVKQVIGIEIIQEAVENARTNAEINGVNNCTFVSGDVIRILTPELVKQYGRPDVIIVDPPRPGMHRKVLEQIIHLKPSRIVYVSCNPMTQLRDIAMLREHYIIEAIQPIDLFPQTFHIESVIKLRAKQ
ncbi:MAG: 23S rRNA (uracil(1939)-C(5))-methyltransferase RlmD [Nitrospira sp.]|nr:23S rRNA (uracil(1939)-C(5))-methyltransferase RlmD [Nitrospira sp.]